MEMKALELLYTCGFDMHVDIGRLQFHNIYLVPGLMFEEDS